MWRSKAARAVLLLKSAQPWRISTQVPHQTLIPTLTLIRPSVPASNQSLFRSFSSSPQTLDQTENLSNPSSEPAEGESLSDLWEEMGESSNDADSVFKSEDLGFGEAKFDLDVEVEKVKMAMDSEDGLQKSFDKMGIEVNEDVVSRVLEESPNLSAEKLLEFFEVVSQMHAASVTQKTLGLLVSAIGRKDDISKMDAYKLWDFVKKLGGEREKGLVGIQALNGLLGIFLKLEKGRAALEVFEKFGDFECGYDTDSYYLTIEALSKINKIQLAWDVCEKMFNAGNLPDGEKIGRVISIFCKGKKVKEAHLVYLKAKEKKLNLDKSVLDVLVPALAKNDETVHQALEVLDEYKGKSLKYANKSFGAVIQGFCRVKNVKEAKKLVLRMVNSGPLPGNAAFNYIITALSKEGDLEEAKELLKIMENRGLRPDIYTYCVIMSGYSKFAMMKEAHELLKEAQKKHEKLSPVCYHIVIRGYVKKEEFDKAIEVLHEMRKCGVNPNSDEYSKLIQSLCLKNMDWRKSEELLLEMEENGLYLKGITRSLVAAVKELENEALNSNDKIEA